MVRVAVVERKLDLKIGNSSNRQSTVRCYTIQALSALPPQTLDAIRFFINAALSWESTSQ
jgi:hypothetical protein